MRKRTKRIKYVSKRLVANHLFISRSKVWFIRRRKCKCKWKRKQSSHVQCKRIGSKTLRHSSSPLSKMMDQNIHTCFVFFNFCLRLRCVSPVQTCKMQTQANEKFSISCICACICVEVVYACISCVCVVSVNQAYKRSQSRTRLLTVSHYMNRFNT